MATLTDSMIGTGGSPQGASSLARQDDAEPQPLQFDPGEIAPFPASPHPNLVHELSQEARNTLNELANLVGNKDVAARRWEVEQALALDTPVPTPVGYVAQGDLRVGDTVFDEDGEPTTVVSLSPIKEEPCYALEFDSGEVIVASEKHPWVTTTRAERRSRSAGAIRTTREIAETLLPGPGAKHANHAIGAVAVGGDCRFPRVDPYLFGVWLGNGKELKNSDRLWLNSRHVHDLRERLAELRIGGAKRIPEDYLGARREPRIALLQGLMDTDGSCTKDGECTWSRPRKDAGLIEDFEFLLMSLGVKCRKRASRAKSGGASLVKIEFTADFAAFRLGRKLKGQVKLHSPRLRPSPDSSAHRHFIVGAKRVGVKTVRCIGVASPAHLYLVGKKGIITHNTWEACLMDRGYQYLLPRKGGGWVLPPFATDYQSAAGRRRGNQWYGYETNIVATYGEIMNAALTRDIPEVRFEPRDPMCDADITAADAATQYARMFSRNNDLIELHQQLVWHLRTGGRAVIVTDHILDAQRFGRSTTSADDAEVVPETEDDSPPRLYLVRHGETELNSAAEARGRAEVPISDRGERQVRAAADWLRGKHIPAIVSSPVERAMDSAAIIARATGAQVTADDRLASLDIGSLAGRPSEDVRREISETPDGEPIGGDGETLDQFNLRVSQALSSLLEEAPPGTVVVAHDSVIGALHRMFEGGEAPPGAIIQPGAVAGLQIGPDGEPRIRPAFPYLAPEPSNGQMRGAPLGMEVAESFGKLEAKVPMNSMRLADMPFVQVSREYDVALVKAMFPDFSDKITPGQQGAGENELDRIARINAALALEASYVTGDSMVRDCTLQKTWFRPSFFFEVKDKALREELLTAFPDGALVVFAGNTLVLCRNENMDDHLTLVQAFPGTGQNRLSLCSKIISVQKRLNNWVDLMNAYYVRTVPQRFLDTDVFDLEQVRSQSSVPGAYIPYSGDKLAERPQQTGMQPIWVEPTPTHQPSMPEFIKMFINDLPQLLTGALPSLFGSPSNTDTVGGIAIQRDQALARLGTPWHAITMATCSYFRQAVQLAARCRTGDIKGMDSGHAVKVELSDLRGNVLCYPEQDANFPESWNQQQQRYQQLLAEATNPIVASILSNPANLLNAQRYLALPRFKIKQAAAYEKQLGELDRLLRGAPVPNPAHDQLAEEISALQARQRQTMAMGAQDPALQQQIDAAIEQLKGIPEQLPSVPVDPETDDNATEASCCDDWYNGPSGRRMRYGSPEDKAAAANVRLHWMAHKQAVAPAGKLDKPLSLSANIKDLPPEDAAAVLRMSGLPSDPTQVAQGRELNAQIKKSSKVQE